ncbi:MAG: MASE3 domain-containing protein [Pseudomonadota bacterium]
MMQQSEEISPPGAGLQEKALLAGSTAALAVPVLLWLGLLELPEILSQHHFFFFHTAMETFAVVVAVLVFSTGFHLPDEKRPTASLLLACAFLGVGLLDFLHMMSYHGLPEALLSNTPHKTIIFWLAARILAAGALLAHVFLLTSPSTGKRPSRHLLLAATLGYVFLFAYAAGWHDEWFPATFQQGRGPTPFKISLELLVIFLHLVTLFILFFRHRCLLALPAFSILAPALLLCIASGLFFSLYTRMTGMCNLLGHIYKVFAYLLIYRGMFLLNIRMPIFRLDRALVSLKRAKDEWRKTFDAIADPMFIHDHDFRITLCNQAYAEAAGLAPHQIIGRPYYEVLPRLDGPHSGCREALTRRVEGKEELFLADEGVTYDVRFVPIKYEADSCFHYLHILRDITGQKETGRHLALIDFALNQVDEIAYLIDETGRFHYVNDAACRTLAYHRDELLGMGLADVDPDFPQERWPGHWLKLRMHVALTFEGRHRRKDGQIFPVEIAANYFEYEGRGYNLALVRDITNRQRTEEALRFQFSFQKLVADLSADFVAGPLERTDTAVNHALALCAGFFQADRSYVFLFSDHRHTMSNTHEYCVAGVEPQIEAIKDVPLSAFPWFSRKILAQEVVHVPEVDALPQEAAAEKAEFSRQATQSLLCIPLISAGRPLGFFGLDAVRKKTAWSGDQIALLSVVADIIAGALARYQTELQLEENAGRLENAQRIAHIGNWDWDAVNKTLVWSNEVYRILGVAPQEFPASYDTFLDYVHPDDRATVDQAVRNALERNLSYSSIEHRIRRPGDGLCWVREQAEILRDETGHPLRMFGTVQDITERKSLEDQILQSRKMEAVGVLAGGIAHDFNNILTPIMMHTQMVLMDTPIDALARHSLEQVHKAAERAKGLVRQILDFSRQGKYEPHPLKIGLVIKEVLKFLRSTIPLNIELESEILTDHDLVRADPTQMLQVIMNLTINAAQAMHEKGGRIVISLDEQEEEVPVSSSGLPPAKKYLKMVVSDTGAGIPPEILPRIFEPYFTTKGKGEGTGMGLAVVHGLVEKHGGVITVRSEPGKGADFEVLLPAVAGEAAPLSGFNQPLPGGRERILFVDDELAVVEAAPALTRLGYLLTTKTDSLEALAVFRDDPSRFDLVITDQAMPGITGSAMAEEMLRLRPDLPVILCTGFSGRIDEETVKKLGIAAFVPKPFGVEDIAPIIRKVLGEDQQFRRV